LIWDEEVAGGWSYAGSKLVRGKMLVNRVERFTVVGSIDWRKMGESVPICNRL
jgi:hypothetical protein